MKNEEWRVVHRTRGSTLKQLWARLRSGLWVPTERFMTEAQMMPLIMGGSPGTVDKQVGASVDDAYEDGGGGFSNSADHLRIYSFADPGSSSYRCSGARFTLVDVPQGATIDTAHTELYIYDTAYDSPNMDIYANDVDDANDFDVEQDVIGRVRTTASVPWEADDIGTGWKGSTIEIKTVIKEVVDRGTWVANNALALLYIAHIEAAKPLRAYSYDYSDNSYGPKLHIEYSVAAAGKPTHADNYMRRRVVQG